MVNCPRINYVLFIKNIMVSDSQTSNFTQFNQKISSDQEIIFACTQKLLRNALDVRAYLERALSWIKLQEYDKAILDLHQALQINPKNPSLYYSRSLAYIGQKNYKQAISDLTAAIKLEPKNVLPYRKRGQTYSLLGQYERAIADFEEALKLEPACPLVYYNRALAYYFSGNYKKAGEDYQKVVQLETKENLAKYYNSKFLSALSGKESIDKKNRNSRHKKTSLLNNNYYLSGLASALVLAVSIPFLNSFFSKNSLDPLQVVDSIELTEKTLESSAIASEPTKAETFPILLKRVKSIKEVKDIPSGSYYYGGSTAWALIRKEVDKKILAQTPEFSLKYREHPMLVASSGAGIKMLLENELTIAHSSRPLHPQEYQLAKEQNFTLLQVPVAIDAVAIVTNPSLDIPGLTLEQLKDIYTGKIVNWKQVGGPDLEIVPYSQPSHISGTAEFFAEKVMKKDYLGSHVNLVNSVTEGIKDTAQHEGAIFYASAPEIIGQCSVKPIPIGENLNNLISPYVEPLVTPQQCPQLRNQINPQLFQEAKYPLTHHLFVVIKQNDEMEEKAGKAYAKMLLSEEGQKLISEAGYLPIH